MRPEPNHRILKTAGLNLAAPDRGSSDLRSAARCLGQQDVTGLKPEYFLLCRRKIHLQRSERLTPPGVILAARTYWVI
jgi:hypothetical protein